MSDERRYGEDEVREIFALAAAEGDDRPGPARGGSEGMTLAEIQEIGAEVDLPPERIAQAATAIALRGGALPRRTQLGMPITVGRVLQLPRALTDREWEILVAELRATFRARGHLSSLGGLREWSNGNLHASVEPTESGYLLRMGTLKESARAFNLVSYISILTGVVMGLVLFFGGEMEGAAALTALCWGFAAAALGTNALTLPRWARRREEQMEHIAGRALALAAGDPPDPDDPHHAD